LTELTFSTFFLLLQSNTQNKYVKNYTFHYRFAAPWSQCEVVMTAVSGHTESLDFGEQYRSWQGCDPSDLFDAPTTKFIEDVT